MCLLITNIAHCSFMISNALTNGKVLEIIMKCYCLLLNKSISIYADLQNQPEKIQFLQLVELKKSNWIF